MLNPDHETRRLLITERHEGLARDARLDALRGRSGGLRPWMVGAVCVLVALLLPLVASANGGRDVTIEMNGTLVGPTTVAGTWTATGAIADSGTYVEQAEFLPLMRVRAVKTLVGAKGTIVLKAKAPYALTTPTTLTFYDGHWEIVSGTGAYAGLVGGGNPAVEGSGDLATGVVHGVHRGRVHFAG
jgi:hypothetical protein